MSVDVRMADALRQAHRRRIGNDDVLRWEFLKDSEREQWLAVVEDVKAVLGSEAVAHAFAAKENAENADRFANARRGHEEDRGTGGALTIGEHAAALTKAQAVWP